MNDIYIRRYIMITLKQILKEVTDWDFEMKYVKDENPNKVLSVLKTLGFRISTGDVKAANKRLATYEGGKMFKHMQYHVVQGSGYPPEVYFIYQTQHYLNDSDVDVTQVSLKKYDDYQGKTTDKKTQIGKALVPTKKFLKGLSRLNILHKS